MSAAPAPLSLVETQAPPAEAPAVAARLLDLAADGSTGILALRRGQVTKDIVFRQGYVVAADSNLRHEALGSHLVARGIISETQMSTLLEEVRARGRKMGAVLVELGWMTPEGVLDELREQVRRRVVGCLRWTDADTNFTAGEPPGERIVEHRLDVPETVFGGLKESATPDLLAARTDEIGEKIICFSDAFSRHRALFERIFGTDAVALLAQAPSVSALVLHPEAESLAQAIEALLLSGTGRLGNEDERAVSAPAALFAAPGSVTERFGGPVIELSGQGTRKILPAMPERPSGRASDSPETEASSTWDHPNTVELRQALLREYLELTGRSPYEVLGITPNSPEAEVAAAYQAKNMRFSPLVGLAAFMPGDEQGRLDAVLGAYARAFTTLSDPTSRLGLAKPKRGGAFAAGGADPLGAELAFGEGRRRLLAGDPRGAMERFQAAVLGRPDQAAYHAYLGWAEVKGGDPLQQSTGRDRITHALTLDPDQSDAHGFLGRLALSDGDDPAARLHLERAVALAPGDEEAVLGLLALLDRLGEERAAEKLCRRVVAQLGDRETALRIRLWRRLGRLDAGRWAEVFPALVATWSQNPGDPGPAAALGELCHAAGEHDTQWLVACAAILRGIDDAEAAALVRLQGPRLLRRPEAPADQSILEQLGYGMEEQRLELRVAQALAAHPPGPVDAQRLAELGVADAKALARDELPPILARCLAMMEQALGVSVPQTLFVADVPQACVVDGSPPRLVLPQSQLSATDPVLLGAQLVRALFFLPPGRAAVSAQDARELATSIGDSSPESLQALAQRLWDTADRLAVLLSGDPMGAGRFVAAHRGGPALERLLEFVLSQTHLTLRQQRGMRISL